MKAANLIESFYIRKQPFANLSIIHAEQEASEPQKWGSLFSQFRGGIAILFGKDP